MRIAGQGWEFEIQSTEVVQEVYVRVMGKNPSRFQREKNCPGTHQVIGEIKLCPLLPVENVSWRDVQEFLEKLNQTIGDGYTYRLPTDSEWEYAARAKTETAYFFGDDISDLERYAWYWRNSFERTHAAGIASANPWGLHDVYGNVAEWVQDDFFQSGDDSWPLYNIVRGGSWISDPVDLRSSASSRSDASVGLDHIGFRLIRTR